MIVPIDKDPIFANAVLNAIFNTSIALLFAPFVGKFARMIQRIIPDKAETSHPLQIDRISIGQKDAHLTTDIALHAAHEDTKQLIRETIDYNTYIWGISHDMLESSSFVLDEIREEKVGFDNETHRKLYDDNQEVATRLLQFLDQVETIKDKSDTHTGNSKLESIIVNCISSMKHIKNIRHNLIALRDSSDPAAVQLSTLLRDQTASLYRQMTTVISRNFTTDHLYELSEAMSKIQSLYAENIDMLTQLGSISDDSELDVASLINITRELYDSAQRILEAVSLMYLTKSEKKMLQQVQ